jgi:hypothetical protein
MDLLYNLKNAKSSREPISRTTPHYHESENIAETHEENRLQLLASSTLALDGLLGEKLLVDIW